MYLVTKKKKSKSRFQDFDSKDKDTNDVLSVFKDAPEKGDSINEVKEVEKNPELAQEDATWEDKVKRIIFFVLKLTSPSCPLCDILSISVIESVFILSRVSSKLIEST